MEHWKKTGGTKAGQRGQLWLSYFNCNRQRGTETRRFKFPRTILEGSRPEGKLGLTCRPQEAQHHRNRRSKDEAVHKNFRLPGFLIHTLGNADGRKDGDKLSTLS